jgi:hypothetical protein
LYLIFIFGYKYVRKSRRVHPATADLITGKDRIGISHLISNLTDVDQHEAEFLAKEAQNPPKNAVNPILLIALINLVVSIYRLAVLGGRIRREYKCVGR